MDKNYNGVSWEDVYSNEELRKSTQIDAYFFRECEVKLRNEKRKQEALARNSLDNLTT